MLVEGQRLAVRAEDLGAARVEHAIRRQSADVYRTLVARVDLDKRLGPVAIRGVGGLNLLADVRSADESEGCRKSLVYVDDAVAEIEYIKLRPVARPSAGRIRQASLHHRSHRLPRESAGLEIR